MFDVQVKRIHEYKVCLGFPVVLSDHTYNLVLAPKPQYYGSDSCASIQTLLRLGTERSLKCTELALPHDQSTQSC